MSSLPILYILISLFCNNQTDITRFVADVNETTQPRLSELNMESVNIKTASQQHIGGGQNIPGNFNTTNKTKTTQSNKRVISGNQILGGSTYGLDDNPGSSIIEIDDSSTSKHMPFVNIAGLIIDIHLFNIIAGLASIVSLLITLWVFYTRPYPKSRFKSLLGIKAVLISAAFGTSVYFIISAITVAVNPDSRVTKADGNIALSQESSNFLMLLLFIAVAFIVASVKYKPWNIAMKQLTTMRNDAFNMYMSEIGKLKGNNIDQNNRAILEADIRMYYIMMQSKLLETIFGDFNLSSFSTARSIIRDVPVFPPAKEV